MLQHNAGQVNGGALWMKVHYNATQWHKNGKFNSWQ